MRRLLTDLRYAARTLRRRPAFTAATILTLAVGIGATTAIFTVADAVLLAPLPYPDPGRLVFLSSGFPGATDGGDQLSYLDIREIAGRARTLEGVAAYSTGRRLPLRAGGGAGDPEPVAINIVSPQYLSLLGATVSRGRLFGPQDDTTPDGHPVAIVTDRFWRNRLSQDPAAIGRTIAVGDRPLTIVGVLAAGFRDV